MKGRRGFIKKSAAGAALFSAIGLTEACTTAAEKGGEAQDEKKDFGSKPLVISTWGQNLKANEAAWEVLSAGGNALDAVVNGVMVPEADEKDQSVGYGGRPDRDGNVTLDSCVMDHESNCGSVAFLQHIKHPVLVARKVMEETPHVMLVGEGALSFALEQGFKKENLLTEQSRKEWEEWAKTSTYKPVINIENHDTIGMLALDSNGKVSGACTTSGAAYKMQGRVGDSPIIGAGLFVDGEVGAATATGLGEAVIKVAGSHLVVELMRQGMSPAEACKAAVERVMRKEPNYKDLQVGFIAINIHGEYGGYSIQSGFSYAVCNENGNQDIKSEHAL